MSLPNLPPSSAPIEIYLGKDGQRFGPFTPEQFDAMRAQPDFGTYTYIWDGRDASPDWKAIEKPAPPPMPARKPSPGAPPPDTTAPAPTPVMSSPIPMAEPRAQAPRPALKGYDVPRLEAICHDSRSVVAGKLTQVTDAGCELVCAQSEFAPAFGSDAPITINLLDPKSGRSMNVAARLQGVHRRGDNWRLKIFWEGCPELVVQQLENSA